MNINKLPVMMRRLAGFTLVEAIMVIAITGILAAIVAVFIKGPVEGYFDSARRADLTDAADTTLKRIARDVQTALPNSLRTTSPASNNCFEFLPMIGGGRYRNAQTSAGAGSNVFNFTILGGFNFDVLADVGVGSLPAGNNQVVVYNLGIPGADAYQGDNRRTISGVAGASPNMTVTLAAGVRFPFESPGRRFHVVPTSSVIYSCNETTLYRSTRPINPAPLAACPAAGAVVVTNVDCAQSSFVYTPAISQRNGLLTLVLTLTQAGESVRLYDEVHVNNVP